MSGIGAILLLAVVTFAAVIWPTRKAAQLVGAHRTGYGTVALAMALSVLLVVGLGFLLAALSLGRGGGIGAALLLAVAVAFMYSRVFGTGMPGGLLIMVIANVIGGAVSVGLALLLGVGGGLMNGSLLGGSQVERFTAAVDGVCACKGDPGCVKAQMAGFDLEPAAQVAEMNPLDAEQMRHQITRLEECTAAASGSGLDTGGGTAGAPGAASQPGQAATSGQSSPAQRYVFVWQDTEIKQLAGRIGDIVRFKLRDGRMREGILLAVSPEAASLRNRETRGMSYDVKFRDVRSVQVYMPTVE